MKQIQRTSVGHYEIGDPTTRAHWTGGPHHTRLDTFVTKLGVKSQDRMFCQGTNDYSDSVEHPYAGEPGNRAYDARCGCCYLGIGHTVKLHDQRIASHEASVSR